LKIIGQSKYARKHLQYHYIKSNLLINQWLGISREDTMNSRILIGVSSPVGYFYRREKEKGRPAPILESPLSYCLLYDEVWFLSRKLCPYNMEKLKFVHFVDEEIQPKGLPKDAISESDNRDCGPFPWDTWNQVIDATTGRRWNYDNHARRLQFGELSLTPTPGRYENLLVDRRVAAEFGMDLVENTANVVWSREFDEQHLKMNISEHILQPQMASLQTVDGPWHPVIEDLRNDNLLKSYRQRIGAIENSKELTDLEVRLAELSAEFERVTSKIVKDHFDTASLGQSAIMFLLGLIPGAGNVIGAIGLLKEVADKLAARREAGWVGFLGKAQIALRDAQQALPDDADTPRG
jgi:hypothetical protein